MNITGIIAEYNPFHNGHAYHLSESKRITDCQGVIAVISGNYVQRGEPSLVNKWIKTDMALKNNIDLVLELPLAYTTSSAEAFAFGGISLLDNINVVDNICFGSETDNIEALQNIASILISEPLEYKEKLKHYLSLGLSFPKARSNSLCEYINSNPNLRKSFSDTQNILQCSNNILAIEYLKSLIRLNSKVKPFTIKRTGHSYNSKHLDSAASATAIRNQILNTKEDISKLYSCIPNETYNILNKINKENYISSKDMLPYVKYKATQKPIINIPDAIDGLENKITKNLLKYDNYDDIINSSKSKRYVLTRIQRIICNYFIGFDNFPVSSMKQTPCPYARVLGFNNKGQEILKEMKYKSKIPIITKLPNKPSSSISKHLNLDILGTNTYSLLDSSTPYNADYYNSPIIIK